MDTKSNKATLQVWGLTKQSEVWRSMYQQLLQNRYCIRSASIETGTEGIISRLGDVINLQHDVPRWGDAGGRIISATSTTVTLPMEVTIAAGSSYGIGITMPDGTEVTGTVAVPATPTVTASIAGEIVTLTWTDCHTTLAIDHYTVGDGTTTINNGPGLAYSRRIDWTGSKTFSIVAYDIGGNAGTAGTVAVSIAAPSAATALTATALPFAIKLTATITVPSGSVLEIWCATTNNRASAALIGETKDGTWVHTGFSTVINTRYYWCRLRDSYGNYGSWYPSSATGGTVGQTSEDPAAYLAFLTGAITEDELASDLLTQLDPGEYFEDMIAPEYSAGHTYVKGESCRIYYNSKWRIYTSLSTQSGHQPPNATYWSSTNVVADRLSVAETDIEEGQDGSWASIADKVAIASYETDQQDSNGYLRIAAAENRLAVYDTAAAPTWSSATTYNPGQIVVRSGIYYRCKKQSTNNQPPNSTYWYVINAGLLAQWTVKLNANGHIAGVGLMLDGSGTSEFIILADKFMIMKPTDTGSAQTPFIVGTVQGVSLIGIDGDLVCDGTIVADAIVSDNIAAVSDYSIGSVNITTDLAGGTTITSANTQSLGTFQVTNTSDIQKKILVIGAGRTGCPNGWYTDQYSVIGVFVSSTKVFDYGWSGAWNDGKAVAFQYTIPANTNVTFTVRGARDKGSQTSFTHNFQMSFAVMGVYN